MLIGLVPLLEGALLIETGKQTDRCKSALVMSRAISHLLAHPTHAISVPCGRSQLELRIAIFRITGFSRAIALCINVNPIRNWDCD